jgi:hypothetical protein
LFLPGVVGHQDKYKPYPAMAALPHSHYVGHSHLVQHRAHLMDQKPPLPCQERTAKHIMILALSVLLRQEGYS